MSDKDVAASIAALDQFVDPLIDDIAELISLQDHKDNVLLDAEIFRVVDNDVRTFALIGVTVCRRRALEKFGSIGIVKDE